MTHQAIKQFQFEHIKSKTRRAGQPGTRCTYGCPYKTYKNLKTTVAKQVQMSKIKATGILFKKFLGVFMVFCKFVHRIPDTKLRLS